MNQDIEIRTSTGLDSRRTLLLAVICTSMAAGMGWGIRGQYGHETGAMIAGALTSLTLVLFFAPNATAMVAARAAAMMTIGIGIGGTMTYGQTVGLTHNPNLAGNWEALRWGMIGLAIKGGIWIGFAGAFLGMGLGGVRYRAIEIMGVMLAAIAAMYLGIWLLNSPFQPAGRILPKLYFSGSWYFEPDNANLKPRPEVWGGMLFAWLTVVIYARFVRRDRLAFRMAGVGLLGGALGFPGGQSIQAFHSWNLEAFQTGTLSQYSFFKFVNWWNMMETGFGLIFGATLAIGLWFNRRLIVADRVVPEIEMGSTTETALLVLHTILLLTSEFLRMPEPANIISQYTNYGLFMCVIPMIGVVGGRLWPSMLLLPVVAAPICGKQMRALVYDASPQYSISVGWMLFVMIPMGVFLVVTSLLISRNEAKPSDRSYCWVALVVSIGLYLTFNTYFFEFAWPWNEWTIRTPNQILFLSFGFIVALATAYQTRSRIGRDERS
jgi:hypothetical protein